MTVTVTVELDLPDDYPDWLRREATFLPAEYGVGLIVHQIVAALPPKVEWETVTYADLRLGDVTDKGDVEYLQCWRAEPHLCKVGHAGRPATEHCLDSPVRRQVRS